MKKSFLLLTLICVLLVPPASAQFEKGKMMASVASTIGLGAFGTDLMNLGFTTQKTKFSDGDVDENYRSFGLNLMPRGGYFVSENLAVGVDLLLSLYGEKSSDSDYKYKETTVAIGPFVRYYYPLEKIYPFLEASVGFGSWKEKWSNGTEGDDMENLFIFGAGVGAAKSLGGNVMIDALLGYSSQSWKAEDDDKFVYGTFGLRIGFSILFGGE